MLIYLQSRNPFDEIITCYASKSDILFYLFNSTLKYFDFKIG